MRMSEEEEALGADYFEHGLGPRAVQEYYRDDSKDPCIIEDEQDKSQQSSAFGTRTGGLPGEDEKACELRKRHTNGIDNPAMVPVQVDTPPEPEAQSQL